jgi:hypothetical protein
MSKNIIRADDKHADTARALSVPPDSPPSRFGALNLKTQPRAGEFALTRSTRSTPITAFPPTSPRPTWRQAFSR